jgi:hypothetical protein
VHGQQVPLARVVVDAVVMMHIPLCPRVAVLAIGAFLLSASAAAAQGLAQSRCADCHFANPGATSGWHLSEWDSGPHGRRSVGCEKCHGGDPTSFEPFVAHQGILSPPNPASPVRASNQPGTCGTCHVGPFANFRKSKHYELLRAGDRDVPTCATCHGEAAGVRLSPRALESRCAQCHGARKVAPHPEFAANGRLALEGLRETRQALRDARRAIERVKDPARRKALEEDARNAEAPIIEATQAGHAFVYDQLEERLETARARLSALLERLANPPAGR